MIARRYSYSRPTTPVRKPLKRKGFTSRPLHNAPGCSVVWSDDRGQWEVRHDGERWHIGYTYDLADANQIAKNWLKRKGYEL
ncbi:MAG: hypothetical protein WCJ64_00495 [Rhodospirillaceae bacterium]